MLTRERTHVEAGVWKGFYAPQLNILLMWHIMETFNMI